eukprot:gene5763-7172_t
MSTSLFSNICSQFIRGGISGPHQFKRAQRGLYGGRRLLTGHSISFSDKKTNRYWKPNVQTKTYYSSILETDVKVKLTAYTIRCIDKAGSFDNYIMFTKDKDLASQLGVDLKKAMKVVMKEKAIALLEIEEEDKLALEQNQQQNNLESSSTTATSSQ